MLPRLRTGLCLLGGALALLAACQRPQGSELAQRAFQRHLSGIPITVSGRVVRLLSDDTRPPAHQRFIIETERGQTLLALYNLDLGGRVPVRIGDRVTLKGEYLWNREGGAVHRLHPGPRGCAPAGWVRLERTGRRYP